MSCRLPKWMLERGLPKIPLAEKCYRQFWWRKGDVYRMLMSLQNIIDGSTWPSRDRRRVNELAGFIHHVTGASLQVSIAPDVEAPKVEKPVSNDLVLSSTLQY